MTSKHWHCLGKFTWFAWKRVGIRLFWHEMSRHLYYTVIRWTIITVALLDPHGHRVIKAGPPPSLWANQTPSHKVKIINAPGQRRVIVGGCVFYGSAWEKTNTTKLLLVYDVLDDNEWPWWHNVNKPSPLNLMESSAFTPDRIKLISLVSNQTIPATAPPFFARRSGMLVLCSQYWCGEEECGRRPWLLLLKSNLYPHADLWQLTLKCEGEF